MSFLQFMSFKSTNLAISDVRFYSSSSLIGARSLFISICKITLYLLQNHLLFHSHKKREGSLETRAVLLMLSLELEISGVVVKRIHQNSEKWWIWGEIAQ